MAINDIIHTKHTKETYMQFPNFKTTQCDILLKNNQQEGIITNSATKTFLCVPINNDNTEQTHLSGEDLTLQYICEQIEKFPNTQIFAIINENKIELTINNQGVIIPK